MGADPAHRAAGSAWSRRTPTCVGGGPFPTEQNNAIGERIRRQVGSEYGTVTGRPRRCGWFDAVVGPRYLGARVSGSTEIAADAPRRPQRPRRAEGRGRLRRPTTAGRSPRCPATLADLGAAAGPVYETVPGWSADLTQARSWGDLPAPGSRVRRLPRAARSVSPSRSSPWARTACQTIMVPMIIEISVVAQSIFKK